MGGMGGGEREREREKPEERESCIGKYSEKSATIQSSTGDASASLCDPAHVHDMKDGGCLADLKIVLGTLFVERDRLCEVGISTSVVLGLGPECLIAQLDPITDSA